MRVLTGAKSVASWLVSRARISVAVCALPLVIIPQTPAKAVSSTDLPYAVAAALGEAVPGFEVGMVEVVWIGRGGFVGVDLLAAGQPLQFKVSALGQILWAGRPQQVGPNPLRLAIDGDLPVDPEDLPAFVAHALSQLAPAGRIRSIRILAGRTPRYAVHIDNGDEGLLDVVVKENGLVVELMRDSDKDGLHDAQELNLGLNPSAADSDGDLFPDGFEMEQGGDPDNPHRVPAILDVEFDRPSKVVILTLQTFAGGEFFIERTRRDRPGWVRLGELIAGDGGLRQVAVPADGFFGNTMFRAGIIEPAEAPAGGGVEPGGEPNASDAPCTVPDALVHRELVVADGKRLCFKSLTKGEVIEGFGGGMAITPFAYTFRKSGHCKAKVTLTFSTPDGFETTVYELTFGNGGTTGAYVASELESGDVEDSFTGDFTLSMNER